MTSLRLWIALLALTCFAAGVSAGLFLGDARAESHPSGLPFGAYRDAFVQRFHLAPERERLFAELLGNYDKEIEDVRTRLLQQSRPELESELASIGARYQSIIRDHVLPPDQRAEFDTLSGTWQAIQ